jgi:hypothetical protein
MDGAKAEKDSNIRGDGKGESPGEDPEPAEADPQ